MESHLLISTQSNHDMPCLNTSTQSNRAEPQSRRQRITGAISQWRVLLPSCPPSFAKCADSPRAGVGFAFCFQTAPMLAPAAQLSLELELELMLGLTLELELTDVGICEI
jgi:hypothetical protein